MPNLLAYTVLFAWPLVTIVLFRALPPHRALIWALLGAFLIVPAKTAVDLPLLPALNKATLPNIAVFLACLPLLLRTKALLPQSPTARVLLAILILAPIGTAFTNGEVLRFGPAWLPALRPYDALSMIVEQVLIILPFLLGRALLAGEAERRDLLWAFVVAALAYSLPMLVEIRLSPQINVWVYGFFPHDFGQQVRFGGFRPVVFLGHGLWVAMFAALGVMAAIALWRHGKGREPGVFFLITLYLSAVLILCKSVGAVIFAALAAPMLRLFSIRLQFRVAACIALIVLSYPVLRSADLIPVDTLLAQAGKIQAERAQSLKFRFDNEDILLERAAEKPVFGWGGYDRNRVFDVDTGARVSTTDGLWIIVIGVRGWAGYVATFGLMTLPILMLWWRGGAAAAAAPYAASVSLILAMNLLDMLPNAFYTPLTWLFAGSLLGFAEGLARAPGQAPAAAAADPGRRPDHRPDRGWTAATARDMTFSRPRSPAPDQRAAGPEAAGKTPYSRF